MADLGNLSTPPTWLATPLFRAGGTRAGDVGLDPERLTTPRSMKPVAGPDTTSGANAEQWLRARRELARRSIVLAAALGALSGVLLVPQAWLLAHALSAVIIRHASLGQVLPWLWPMIVILAARFALAQAAERSAFAAAAKVKEDVRSTLVRHLQALGPGYAHGRASGELAVAVVDAVEALEPYYARYLPHLALLTATPLAVLAAVVPRDWISGVVLVVSAPLVPLFMVLLGRGAERLNQRQWRKLARMSGRFLDALRGLTTLKLFNACRREAGLVAQLSDDYRRSTMAVLRVAFLSALVLEFFATVSIALVAVLIGFRLLAGDLGLEAGLFVLLLAPEFYLPLRQLGTQYHARMEAIGAAERIIEVLNAERPVHGGRGRPPFPRAIDIRFEDVHFAYAPGRAALRGASFAVQAERLTALVGRSGAGKSTALNVLLGFLRPDDGCVLVGGHDLAAVDPEHWLRQVAWVPQRGHVFRGSILDNIRMGDARIGLAAVRAAARMAHADEFIERLPRGYDTPVDERGRSLSGGEVQRLALARAFLKDAPVVLMDEATASLDAVTEAFVAQAIARLVRGRTTFVVAHRLHTVKNADQIVVLEAGRVVASGTHESLVHGDTHYARMARATASTCATT